MRKPPEMIIASIKINYLNKFFIKNIIDCDVNQNLAYTSIRSPVYTDRARCAAGCKELDHLRHSYNSYDFPYMVISIININFLLKSI